MNFTSPCLELRTLLGLVFLKTFKSGLDHLDSGSDRKVINENKFGDVKQYDFLIWTASLPRITAHKPPSAPYSSVRLILPRGNRYEFGSITYHS
jgi:hypothetical protein